MTRYFHICHDSNTIKGGDLEPNLTVGLFDFLIPTHAPGNWEPIKQMVDTTLPDGVSFWGQKVLLRLLEDEFMERREYECERIRLAEFPALPSRLQSFFACESMVDARNYVDLFECPEATIWEIEHDGSRFRGDMRWLDRCEQEDMEQKIRSYWSGSESDSPNWEWLLIPPIKVIGVVNDSQSEESQG